MSKAIPEAVTRLIEQFSRLPGIGPKSASRLTYFLLRAPDEQARSLAEAIAALKAETRYCSICYNITTDDPCAICADPERDRRTIAVVEEPLNVLAVERTQSYKGLYHVLHGAISPVEGIGPDDLRINELVARLEAGDNQAGEVIIATNPGLEGDATAMYIQKRLAALNVRVTRLARGLPTGGDLDYVDSMTLTRALEGRVDM
ncbi:MAG: recombination protein RecR [Anaerolineae bacterium]|nr:recombination protein RecR [Anaerolineae bacterium]